MRLFDWIAALLMAIGLVWQLFGSDGDEASFQRHPPIEAPDRRIERVAPRLPPSRAQELPPPMETDPVFRVHVERRRGTSTGTAFAIEPGGLWLTARHVVQDCPRVALRGERGWVRTQIAWMHPRADLALLRTQGGAEPFALSAEPLVARQEAFGIGFPQGKPGAVHGRVLGRSQMQAEGRFSGRAPTVTWAELARVPDFSGSLGGISGGPLLDARGNLLGVVVSESPRRGRFDAIAPEVLAGLTQGAGADAPLRRAAPGETSAMPLSGPALGRISDALRARRSITQAICSDR